MRNKLIDAYGPDDTMRLSFEAGAGVNEINLSRTEAAKTIAVLAEWLAERTEEA